MCLSCHSRAAKFTIVIFLLHTRHHYSSSSTLCMTSSVNLWCEHSLEWFLLAKKTQIENIIDSFVVCRITFWHIWIFSHIQSNKLSISIRNFNSVNLSSKFCVFFSRESVCVCVYKGARFQFMHLTGIGIIAVNALIFVINDITDQAQKINCLHDCVNVLVIQWIQTVF